MVLRFLILTFCLATLCLSSDEINSRVDALESRMAAIKNKTVLETAGARLASASPLFDGLGFFATADFLYWHLQEGSSDYSLPLSEQTPTGKVSHTHFNWEPGFRTGVGYNFEHDAWDWYLNFTWLHANANNTARRHKNNTLAPQKGFPLSFNATKMRSHWHVHYYVLDLEVGRRFFVSKFLSFRPQFGLESAWISQRRRYQLRGDFNRRNRIFGENIYGKNNFWGIGPRAGTESIWYFNSYFSLMGVLSGSLQWGEFDNHLKETALTSRRKMKRVDVDGDSHKLVPNVQMALGLSWDSNINDDMNHLGIRLSYEFQYWWRQNQFLNEQQSSATNFEHESKDLSLNGITLDVRFDF